jgi:CBS domain-containing protein
MKVHELMRTNVQCCRPETNIVVIAREMVAKDCGMIPVVEGARPVGVVTDRDIATRVVAEGRNAFDVCARDVMSTRPICIEKNASLDECCGVMGEHHLRRLLVVTETGELTGVISVDDIAKSSDPHETGHLIKLVCEPEQAAVNP